MSNDPEAGRKLRVAIEDYAKNQVTGRDVSTLDAVLECFVPDEQSQNEVRSLLIDLVFRYILAAGRLHFNATTRDDPDDRLDRFLAKYTRLTGETLSNFRKRLKQAILTTQAESPKSERKDRILQKQAQYFCYLCGEHVNDDDVHVDHVWPQNAGGGTGNDNLRKVHAACDILKHDLAVPGDAPVGRFAYHDNLPRQFNERARNHWHEQINDMTTFTALLDDVRASTLRIALVIRQQAKCYFCDSEFRSTGSVQVVRIEECLPWWLPNAVVCCEQCQKERPNAKI